MLQVGAKNSEFWGPKIQRREGGVCLAFWHAYARDTASRRDTQFSTVLVSHIPLGVRASCTSSWMDRDEARGWLRVACASLSVAQAVAFGAQSCGTGIANSPFNMLMFQQQTTAARQESALVQPPRGSHAGIFVQPSSLASRTGEPRLVLDRYLFWLTLVLGV